MNDDDARREADRAAEHAHDMVVKEDSADNWMDPGDADNEAMNDASNEDQDNDLDLDDPDDNDCDRGCNSDDSPAAAGLR
jgi:hypothetical protein